MNWNFENTERLRNVVKKRLKESDDFYDNYWGQIHLAQINRRLLSIDKDRAEALFKSEEK